MKKIFECSNGIKFFSNGESVVGTLSKEEAIEFVTEVAKSAVEIEDRQGFEALLKLLAAIRNRSNYNHIIKCLTFQRFGIAEE